VLSIQGCAACFRAKPTWGGGAHLRAHTLNCLGSVWAQWAGLAQPLDMSIFQQGTQTNEFGEWRGSAENPTCMPAPAVCGDMQAAYNATTATLCCPGLTCACSTDDDSHLCRCA